MHSQLMFNECIAKTRSRKREDSVHRIHSIHISGLDRRYLRVCFARALLPCRKGFEEGFLTYLPAANSGEE